MNTSFKVFFICVCVTFRYMILCFWMLKLNISRKSGSFCSGLQRTEREKHITVLTGTIKKFWFLTSVGFSILPGSFFCSLHFGYSKCYYVFNLLSSSTSSLPWQSSCLEKTINWVGIPSPFFLLVPKLHSDYTSSCFTLTLRLKEGAHLQGQSQ